jgi:Fe-S cluster assembly scaffold protein SufB
MATPMTTMSPLVEQMYASIGVNPHSVKGDPNIAHIEIHQNRVLGVHLVPGFEVEAEEREDGIAAVMRVRAGVHIDKPVQVCFGVIPETGLQRIELDITVEDGARVGILAHCTFPFARSVRHEMDAVIRVGRHAEYAYFERHVHGAEGGVIVIPKTRVHVAEGGRFRTDFELIKGRVGEIDIDLDATCEAHSVLDVLARVSGSQNDRIRINETARLVGEGARGVLNTHIALRDEARAEVYNTLIANAPEARGHVDCKEIVQGNAIAKAVPIVEVNNPKAHVTHEAAIGSVDSKQLETLMSRGLTEDEAVDLIIQGLLS